MDDLKTTDPTKPEFAILKLLWREKNLNARQIHREIGQEFGWSYSTVRTVLERMTDKKLITKTPVNGVNVYAPKIGKVALLSRMIADFSKRVLELDTAPAAAFFADSKLLSADELEELEDILRKSENNS